MEATCLGHIDDFLGNRCVIRRFCYVRVDLFAINGHFKGLRNGVVDFENDPVFVFSILELEFPVRRLSTDIVHDIRLIHPND